ncbi:hypothetical protein LJ756_02400 [Arthrobacter sp. zg-Y411]|uniref:hypothetical protein n=1 Tax=Arthrobacter zhangbolii TaxID=2886936 RepID=UPI001D1438A7|nr:hypothetical protein [Arthrobacter zhangbolii]MCC3293471.1 hypothetical protein [Arthrobacter zhangbolii]
MNQTLVFDFDSIEQRSLEGGPNTVAPLRIDTESEQVLPFAGVLRAADLLSRRILLLDAQLLDGAFFLTLGPDRIRQILARPEFLDSALAVAARKPSLAESLRAMILDARNPSVLAGFEFSSLAAFGAGTVPLTERLRVRSSARLRSCEPRDVARTVAAELQAASESEDPEYVVEEPTGAFAELERAWQSWLAEADGGRLRIQPWSGTFDLPSALERRPVPAALQDQGGPVEAALTVLSGTKNRSDALAYLRLHSSELSEHKRLLQDWWMNAYFDALASMHGTNWLRFSADPGTQESLPRRGFRWRRVPSAADSPTLQIRGSLVSTLGGMPSPVYALLRHQARAAILEWQEHPSQKTSDGLAYAVSQADATKSRRQARRAVWTRVGLTLGPALIGTVAADAFSSLFAGVGSALAAVVVGVPLAEFLELHESGKKKMRAHIHFPAVRQ